MSPPILVNFLRRLCPQARWKQEAAFRLSILVLTYLSYMSYHLSRKPISIVKNAKAFLDCDISEHTDPSNVSCRSWITEIDGKTEKEAKTYLGFLDTSYLFSYAFFMFLSGLVAERVDLRFFLSIGMMMSGLLTVMFGMAYSLGIHSIWYLIFIQIACGMFQTTGWPGVVSVMANWFGKGKRGVIMGIWNSHTSLGNILGSLIAGAFVTTNWGMSFTVPGMIIGGLGFLIFLFLVPNPEDVDLVPPVEQRSSQPQSAYEEDDPLMNGNADKDEESPPPSPTPPPVRSPQSGSPGAIGFFGALRIPGVVEFSLCLFFSKLVSYTFLYWLPNYIHTKSHVNAEEAAVLSTIYDWGNVGGVPVHDACFSWNILVLFSTGILVNGPYALITTAVSAEIINFLGQHPSLQGSHKALATVTAIIDGTGSIGAAIGPLLAGPLSGNGHWERVFYMLMGADILALILLVRLTKHELIKLRRNRWSLRSTPDYRSINNS
ncbi:LOW QUALITY PROTEIN: glucose-6-phosphate exchanger SLC37A2-like [Eurytemora carolleeae]|uniref:LOW QUALITY PROTEIN: glucose-6-phosphate exchanger SLC37A2-like n=1 Tax=Eurytemora carolleeae TaxID=1294199 RepID=UPI000C758888|nr:LOW QUALITY PROTEIN: glucose-6-phosphate exchanger SLC37A2-like [Eurytemora carolleeae]|eukprot:XP_023339399.1 LOW QUALITY PROTEIN: glucose-6-phosphate exchanger SLC37A2-like [Eurytemora affinis]